MFFFFLFGWSFSILSTHACVDLYLIIMTNARTYVSLCAADDLRCWEEVCRRLVRGLDRLQPGVNEHRLIVFMALRRLLLYRHGTSKDSMNQYFHSRGIEVYGSTREPVRSKSGLCLSGFPLSKLTSEHTNDIVLR